MIKRGVTIGAFTSQPLCNFAVDFIDHYIKEQMRIKCHLRYCDDRVTLTRTKAEAKRVLYMLDKMSSENGLCIKHEAVISPIKRNEKRKKRKRMRGGDKH